MEMEMTRCLNGHYYQKSQAKCYACGNSETAAHTEDNQSNVSNICKPDDLEIKESIFDVDEPTDTPAKGPIMCEVGHVLESTDIECFFCGRKNKHYKDKNDPERDTGAGIGLKLASVAGSAQGKDEVFQDLNEIIPVYEVDDVRRMRRQEPQPPLDEEFIRAMTSRSEQDAQDNKDGYFASRRRLGLGRRRLV